MLSVSYAHLEIGDSTMRRKWEARQSVLRQIVPDLVPDLGFAITYNNNDKNRLLLPVVF